MLRSVISDYLSRAERAVLQCPDAYVEQYLEEVLTPERVNLRIRIRFVIGHLLEISEAIITDNSHLDFLDYRFHFQDESNRMVFRYDSTPHFPNLQSFPHHKHLPNAVIKSDKPSVDQVLMEAQAYLGAE